MSGLGGASDRRLDRPIGWSEVLGPRKRVSRRGDRRRSGIRLVVRLATPKKGLPDLAAYWLEMSLALLWPTSRFAPIIVTIRTRRMSYPSLYGHPFRASRRRSKCRLGGSPLQMLGGSSESWQHQAGKGCSSKRPVASKETEEEKEEEVIRPDGECRAGLRRPADVSTHENQGASVARDIRPSACPLR